MPKFKAYAIIHDGRDVLVGTGGGRKGYHLPGGTVGDKDFSKSKKNTLDQDSAISAVEREMKEELGIKECGKLQNYFRYNFKMAFVVYYVKSLDEIVFDKNLKKGSLCDRPFDYAEHKSLKDAATEEKIFTKDDQTDWFWKGVVKALENNIVPIIPISTISDSNSKAELPNS